MIKDELRILSEVEVSICLSWFKSFEKLYDNNLVKIISIGESTSGYIRECGFSPIITSRMQSYDGVADSIISHFNSK